MKVCITLLCTVLSFNLFATTNKKTEMFSFTTCLNIISKQYENDMNRCLKKKRSQYERCTLQAERIYYHGTDNCTALYDDYKTWYLSKEDV